MIFGKWCFVLVAGVLTVALFLFQNCGSLTSSNSNSLTSPTPVITPMPPVMANCAQCVSIYSQMNWETTGGADLGFNVTPNTTDAGFTLTVYRYNHQAVSKTILLSTATNEGLRSVFFMIFTGSSQPYAQPPSGALGGVFNNATFTPKTGNPFTLNSPYLPNYGSNPFSVLSGWVFSQL